jgi:alkylated DNA repair dioxygenase AlkB
MDLFSNQEKPELIEISLEHGRVLLIEEFLNPVEANQLFHKLRDSIKWAQEYLTIYGKVHPFPRQTAWYGDPGADFKYSGKMFDPWPWTSELLSLKYRIEDVFPDYHYNSVLLNRYRNGNDKVVWHSDNEKAFGVNPTIASVSLGATRRFDLRYKPDKTKKHRFNLTSGSLLIMTGELQTYWEHQVPQQKNIVAERINLTFRKVEGYSERPCGDAI